MAIQKIKEGNSFNSYTQIFQIDSTDDLVTLEADYNPHFGDKAELPNGTVYVRHSDDYQGDKWEVVQSSGGGSGGGSDLPNVTSEDNGSILEVKNGEWNKGEAHYIVTEEAESILSESTIEPLDYSEELGGSIGAALVSKKPEKGDECIVVLNGETFYKVADEMTIQGQTITIIGDNIYYGEELETFLILFSPTEDTMQMIWLGSDSITLKIDVISKNISITEDFTTAVKLANDENNKIWILKNMSVPYRQDTIEQSQQIHVPLSETTIAALSEIENVEEVFITVNNIKLDYISTQNQHIWEKTENNITYQITFVSTYLYFYALDENNDPVYDNYTINIYTLFQDPQHLPDYSNAENGEVLSIGDNGPEWTSLPDPPAAVWQQYTMFRDTTTGYAIDATEFLDKNANSVSIDTIINQVNAGMLVRILGHNDGYYYYMSEYNDLKFVAIADPTHWVKFSVHIDV